MHRSTRLAQASAALLLACAAATANAQWVTNGSSIYYSTGNVGVRESNPAAGVHAVSTTLANGVGVLGVGHSQSLRSIGVRGVTYSGNGYGGFFDGGQFGVFGRSVAPNGNTVGVWGEVSSPIGWGGVFKGGRYGVWGEADGPGRFAGYFMGNVYASRKVGVGTTNPLTPFHVMSDEFGYGFRHTSTDLSSDLSTYADSDGGWIGTSTPKPLLIFTNEGGAQAIFENGSGNFGVGNNRPYNRIDVNAGATIGPSALNGTSNDASNRGFKVGFGYRFNETTDQFHGMRVEVLEGTNSCGNTIDLAFHTAECNTSTSREVMRINGSGNVIATGTIFGASKQFRIDHPLDPQNKFLMHTCIESPDMKNIYDGTITTDADGFATVTLPDYFEALNRDFRYQLTVIDESEDDFIFAKVYRKIGVEAEGQFTIKTSMPNIEVSWQVTGIREDAWAEQNRSEVVVEKTAAQKGKFVHPAAWGLPAERDINYTVPAAEPAALPPPRKTPRPAKSNLSAPIHTTPTPITPEIPSAMK